MSKLIDVAEEVAEVTLGVYVVDKLFNRKKKKKKESNKFNWL